MALSVLVVVGPASATETNPATITYPAGIQAGDVLLLHWGIASGIQVPVVSGELVNWHRIGPNQNADFPRQFVYVKEAAGTESSTTFEVSSDGTALKIIRVLVYRGVGLEFFPLVFEGRDDLRVASTDQVTHPDLITTGDDRLGLCFFVSNPDTSTGNFTGETGGDFVEIATASSAAGATLTTQVQEADLLTATTVSGGSFTADETLAAFRTIVLALLPPLPTVEAVPPVWRLAQSPAGVVGDLRIRDVAYSPGLDRLVAVGDNNFTGSARVLESDDGGETWTVNTSAPSNNYRGVCWAPWLLSSGAFVLVTGGGGPAGAIVVYNGTDFFTRTVPNKSYISVAADPINEVIAAVAAGGTNPVSFSVDGSATTWTAGTLADQNWQRVRALLAGGFIACSTTGASHRIALSADGDTWTLAGGATTTANGWLGIGMSPDRIVCVADSGSDRVMYSDDDGVTWTKATAADDTALWAGVLWVPERQLWVSVARGDSAGDPSPDTIQISDDAETWTLQQAPEDPEITDGWGHWNDVIRVPAIGGRGLRLVAVSGGGTASPFPVRGLIMLGKFVAGGGGSLLAAQRGRLVFS